MLDSAQIFALTRELNHVLWTGEKPEVPKEVQSAVAANPQFELLGTNMQCVAHSVVCAAIFVRRGYTVVTRGGSALVVYPEQLPSDEAHFVVKHWWITTTSGLCDLSLNLRGFSSHKPVIFGNRNLTDPKWRVSFTHDFRRTVREARECHAANECGVFYQTDAKQTVSPSGLEGDLLKTFTAAENIGISLRFIDIVEHCERLLEGKESVAGLPQLEAWRRLRK